ncbi:glycine zipper 2TM domain-containing protein [Noviherbaspirillum sp. UKPF54]|uniref:glycine zipper 2TM domain-containing protein n=1 Tax=Noviherbaspirillum sp. UKPF54 TaxID=2601898 RepID=UPI0011B123F2|nr:glycine zipper 2TM domain-containing protein [Noviherbaspirillum sp. UKPF54]QDZ27366.1 glycine zipper 2TM domain-containing protein [Noviherbaspirillum sp. UKPF54]
MENNTTTKRMHPLVAGAAISVILVSLTGVAAITGLLPKSHSTNSPEPVAAAAAPAVGANTLAAVAPGSAEPSLPASKPDDGDGAKPVPAPQRSSVQRAHSQPRHARTSEPVAQAPAICSSCGRVESVQALHQQAKPSGVGVVAGAVLGGVLGNQVGGGNGRALATVAGAVGGGYAGNEIEKRSRATTSYEVRVRMEDGSVRSFPYAQQPGWSVGDRVRVVNGHLAERA